MSPDFSSFFEYPGAAERADQLVFLAKVSEADWAKLLGHTETRRFSAGEEVMRKGEQDDALLLIAEGRVEIILDPQRRHPKQFSVIEAPSVVGEVEFFDGGERSASVRALTGGELLRLSAEAFEVLAAREPQLARAMLLDLGRILASRMRRAGDLISTFVE